MFEFTGKIAADLEARRFLGTMLALESPVQVDTKLMPNASQMAIERQQTSDEREAAWSELDEALNQRLTSAEMAQKTGNLEAETWHASEQLLSDGPAPVVYQAYSKHELHQEGRGRNAVTKRRLVAAKVTAYTLFDSKKAVTHDSRELTGEHTGFSIITRLGATLLDATVNHRNVIFAIDPPDESIDNKPILKPWAEWFNQQPGVSSDEVKGAISGLIGTAEPKAISHAVARLLAYKPANDEEALEVLSQAITVDGIEVLRSLRQKKEAEVEAFSQTVAELGIATRLSALGTQLLTMSHKVAVQQSAFTNMQYAARYGKQIAKEREKTTLTRQIADLLAHTPAIQPPGTSAHEARQAYLNGETKPKG